MAKRVLNFDFDELPLVIEGGFEAGIIAGSAEVSYFPDGEWSIGAINLDGHRRRSVEESAAAVEAGKPVPMFERKPVELDVGTSLYLAIYSRLETEWRNKVQDAVIEAIAEDRECAAEERADRIRDERSAA